jgi:hypothetical protein
MKMSFPIGFWNYTHIDRQDASAVREWADAGMTLAMGPDYGPGPEHTAKMRAILDAAADAGIRVILCAEIGYWRHLTQVGEETYRRDFAAAVTALGDHPAVFGFHVGDEPGTAEFADACHALRIQKELAPHLQPFLNLLPMYLGIESRIGYFDWDRYLDAYVEAAAPPLLCYDCYAQMNPDSEDAEFAGFEMFFANLRAYHEAAQRHGIDFWTTLLSVGHFRYRCPREDDLRWQLNTALAHGAKGLLWFFFYMRQPHDNYRVSPIDEHGERTETFAWLSRVCRTFLKWHAPVLLDCTLLRAVHVGRRWGGWPVFDGQGRVAEAHSSSGTPLIVSEFAHANGSQYLAVVNNSQRESTQAELVVRGTRPNLYRVGWLGSGAPGGFAPPIDDPGAGSEHGEDYIKLRCWLAPGQMELYCLTGA